MSVVPMTVLLSTEEKKIVIFLYLKLVLVEIQFFQTFLQATPADFMRRHLKIPIFFELFPSFRKN